ncbi:MAG: serine/threonine-protein kinase [Byssovorax sp.]
MAVPPSPQQAHLVPGYRLDDRYELLYPFAQGGMATVWVARIQGKHGFEKLVAVKTILPHLASEPGFRTMFLDEARIASGIRHPNVAEVHDLGEELGTLYMVLEWVSGDSWSKLYSAVSGLNHPFPVHLLIRIAADACAGLHAAHELRDASGALLNVVHRDVSPQNILISTAGITKVIDFGIAKALDRTAEETRAGMLKGKASYASPEQARMKGVDRRADLWAMGTILYQYLSGTLPYEGKNDLVTLKNLISGKPPRPLPPHVPPALAAVVMRALAPTIDERFPNALEMQRALEAAQVQPTTQADVAAFLHHYLAERLETKRRDIAEALEEAAQRAGHAPKPRGRLGSLPELAPPPIVEQVLGGPRPVMSSVPEIVPPAPGLGGFGAPPRPPSHAPPPPEVDDGAPTKVQGLSALKPRHWVMMAVGAAVPIAVWSLVVMTLLGSGKTRLPVKPAPSAQQAVSPPVPSATGAPSLPR